MEQLTTTQQTSSSQFGHAEAGSLRQPTSATISFTAEEVAAVTSQLTTSETIAEAMAAAARSLQGFVDALKSAKIEGITMADEDTHEGPTTNIFCNR